jgi:hypothetical protein
LVFDGTDGGHGEGEKGEDFGGCGADGGVECDALEVVLALVIEKGCM